MLIWSRLLLSFVILFAGALANGFAMWWGEERSRRVWETRPDRTLSDAGFDALPDDERLNVTGVDYGVVGYVLAVLIGMFVAAPTSLERIRFLRRVCTLFGFAFAIRALTIGTTQLPRSMTECHLDRGALDGWVLVDALAFAFFWHSGCHDQVTSGHTALVVLTALFWSQVGWIECRRHRILHVVVSSLVYGGAVACLVVIIATHFHYTIDVLLALVINLLLFAWYRDNARLAIATMGRTLPEQVPPEGRHWSDPFVRWMEQEHHYTVMEPPTPPPSSPPHAQATWDRPRPTFFMQQTLSLLTGRTK